MDALKNGFNGVSFEHLYNYLVFGGGGIADPYMCLADFDSYCMAHKQTEEDYLNRETWNRMSLVNIAKSGIFSADRSIRDYADGIWHIKPILEKNNKK